MYVRWITSKSTSLLLTVVDSLSITRVNICQFDENRISCLVCFPTFIGKKQMFLVRQRDEGMALQGLLVMAKVPTQSMTPTFTARGVVRQEPMRMLYCQWYSALGFDVRTYSCSLFCVIFWALNYYRVKHTVHKNLNCPPIGCIVAKAYAEESCTHAVYDMVQVTAHVIKTYWRLNRLHSSRLRQQHEIAAAAAVAAEQRAALALREATVVRNRS